jgi:hypothetical protein
MPFTHTTYVCAIGATKMQAGPPYSVALAVWSSRLCRLYLVCLCPLLCNPADCALELHNSRTACGRSLIMVSLVLAVELSPSH